jgi:hypothetical protein
MQPNEILKSERYRGTRSFITGTGPIRNWTGTLTIIRTNQGGSNATLAIRIGSSILYDHNVPIGTPVYASARSMREGQQVTFSGGNLSDANLTERGKVCGPNFEIHLSSLH